MVKFSHSVFALPFAFSGAALAASRYGITTRQVLLIALAMVGARNAAMGFNRLADHAIDAANPRTRGRELPRGVVSRAEAWTLTVALVGVFVAAAFALNPLCGALSPVAVAVIFGYSYTKRFTWASHLVLGASLAIAPVGGWLAIAGRFSPEAFLLAAAVVFWVAGFDTIYALQDEAFDRAAGLHSIPARFGTSRALVLARAFHAVAFAALAAVGPAAGLPPVYEAGVVAVGALLVWQHLLVRRGDLARVGVAFLNANGMISVLYFAVVLLALAARHA